MMFKRDEDTTENGLKEIDSDTENQTERGDCWVSSAREICIWSSATWTMRQGCREQTKTKRLSKRHLGSWMKPIQPNANRICFRDLQRSNWQRIPIGRTRSDKTDEQKKKFGTVDAPVNIWCFPPKNRATPSHHPFLDGIFPNKNHPAIKGHPHDYGNPHLIRRYARG